MCKTSIFKIFFPCLYNFTLPKYVPIGSESGSSENFPAPDPDPTTKVRFQQDPDSDPDPQPCLFVNESPPNLICEPKYAIPTNIVL